MVYYPKEIEYSQKYYDDIYEYRHVLLPREFKTKLTGQLLNEEEWRSLGVQQSKGWEHYCVYAKEIHVLLFRRPKGINPSTGTIPDEVKLMVNQWEKRREQCV